MATSTRPRLMSGTKESCPTMSPPVGHDSFVPSDPPAPDRLDWPLMQDNITADDLAAVRNFLAQPEMPILTQSRQVAAFERAWSDWLGVKYSVMVNSGSSANLITLGALRWQAGPGGVIVPPLTLGSAIA